tara:strand:+ start:36 stop:515 length:480 start_codon:yes stop_codon:yes gene_type:complete
MSIISKPWKLYNAAKKAFTGGAQKTTGTEVISSVNIGKNLTKKKTIKDDLIKSRDKHLAGVRDEAKVEIKSKNPLSKFTKKIEQIVDKKAKGGRVGLKRGTNLDKIKKTFGPDKSSFQSRMTRKKKKKGFPDVSGDGKITKKDILMAKGVIPKPKKKVI